jgi:hypothetical protein
MAVQKSKGTTAVPRSNNNGKPGTFQVVEVVKPNPQGNRAERRAAAKAAKTK